jgi:hypothetical protein
MVLSNIVEINHREIALQQQINEILIYWSKRPVILNKELGLSFNMLSEI